MKKLLFLLTTLFSLNSYAQLVFNSGGLMKLNGGTSGTPIYVVLGNTSIPTTPITVNTSGGIISEGEYNKLRYPVGAGSTDINVPFIRGTSVANTVGVNFDITTAGVGAGTVDFSNKAAAATATGWDNSTFMPSMVTHMSQNTSPGTNGSDYAIDRFWIINATGYTTKPITTLTFTYLDDEFASNTSAGSNTITETNLQAQRFNSTSSIWGDFLSGTQSGQTVTVTAVSAANLFAAWTLSDKTNPLPIELAEANVKCINPGALITWTTASEINNAYFTIEKSSDGNLFSAIATIQGAGYSTSPLNYSYNDDTNIDGIVYYRIKQTDFDGASKYSKIFSISCGNNNNFEFTSATANADGQLTLYTSASEDEARNVRVVNTLGQLIYENKKNFSAGTGQLNINTTNLAAGIYYISLFNDKSNLVKKVYVN